MAKKIFYEAEARDKVLSGAKQLYDAVKVTFGPKGQNVIIEKQYGAPVITHDGVTVAEAVELGDELAEKLRKDVKDDYLVILMTAGPADGWLRDRFGG